MDFSEKWGKDVEDAVKLALTDLRLERDQVEVIVLEEPTRGFFGLGSKLAKVRVQKKAAGAIPAPIRERPAEKREKPAEKRERPAERDKPRGQNKQSSAPKEPVVQVEKDDGVSLELKNEGQKQKPKRQRSKPQNTREDASFTIRERPADLQEENDAPALDFLKDVIRRMGLDLEVKAFANESCLYFEISGKDSGTIIGKRGQTLDSIQYLTSLVVNKDKDKYQRVVVDAENYRAKREKTLEQLAKRLAEKVQKSGKSVRLEPMNPYERKVIHATLQSNSAVTTKSEGEEPYRRVVIERK